MSKTEHTSPPSQYADWLSQWKNRIQAAQIKAAIQVNTELLHLYWALGGDILAKQETAAWGEGLIPRFAKDIKAAFPHLTGFSRTNLFYIGKWYLFYQEAVPIVPQVAGQLENAIVPQLVAQFQKPEAEVAHFHHIKGLLNEGNLPAREMR